MSARLLQMHRGEGEEKGGGEGGGGGGGVGGGEEESFLSMRTQKFSEEGHVSVKTLKANLSEKGNLF